MAHSVKFSEQNLVGRGCTTASLRLFSFALQISNEKHDVFHQYVHSSANCSEVKRVSGWYCWQVYHCHGMLGAKLHCCIRRVIMWFRNVSGFPLSSQSHNSYESLHEHNSSCKVNGGHVVTCSRHHWDLKSNFVPSILEYGHTVFHHWHFYSWCWMNVPILCCSCFYSVLLKMHTKTICIQNPKTGITDTKPP